MEQRRDNRNTRGRRFTAREKPEFDQKVLAIRRVARVVAGGRRFSFSVALALGNRKGRVGIGIGKAADTSMAMGKAVADAKKRLITIPLTAEVSLPYEIEAKFGSTKILIKPAPGRGLSAGSSLRVVLELAGVRNVNAKIISRSKNKLNIAKATIKALSLLQATSKK